MQLPEGLENRRFTEWNCLVRGLMEAWELARSRGEEELLEQRLLDDESGLLVDLLGRLGYVSASVSCLTPCPCRQTEPGRYADGLSADLLCGVSRPAGPAVRADGRRSTPWISAVACSQVGRADRDGADTAGGINGFGGIKGERDDHGILQAACE